MAYIDVSALSEEELDRMIEEVRKAAPAKQVKKSTRKKGEPTASQKDLEELAKLFGK